jgi:DNA-nicking Smr family endonuclease
MDWKPPSRKRALTADEAELWTHTMRDAKALRRRGRGKKLALVPEIEAATYEQASSSPALKPESRAKASSAPRPAPSLPPASLSREPSQPKAPHLASYDENERRRLGKNPELIDARLDLHGMRQREAHTALRSFLFSCAVRGFRHVLIITGKGTAAERQRDFFGEERGVLRRLVPQWLGDPDLRPLVVSYAVSHIRHGGEGALYVRLRKAGPR